MARGGRRPPCDGAPRAPPRRRPRRRPRARSRSSHSPAACIATSARYSWSLHGGRYAALGVRYGGGRWATWRRRAVRTSRRPRRVRNGRSRTCSPRRRPPPSSRSSVRPGTRRTARVQKCTFAATVRARRVAHSAAPRPPPPPSIRLHRTQHPADRAAFEHHRRRRAALAQFARDFCAQRGAPVAEVGEDVRRRRRPQAASGARDWRELRSSCQRRASNSFFPLRGRLPKGPRSREAVWEVANVGSS